MQIRRLIEVLEEQAQAFGDETEVRLMTQQSWPFENSICGVTATPEFSGEDDEPEDEGRRNKTWDGSESSGPYVYLVEGAQLCYGNKDAWDACYR